MNLRQFFPVIYAILIVSSSLHAQELRIVDKPSLLKPFVRSANNFDGNRIDCDMENNGQFVSQNVSGRSGLTWPKGNGTQTIYASGVWLGGIVDSEIRVSAAEFGGEFASGPWGANHEDPNHKIYKVKKSDLADPRVNEDFQSWPVELGAPWVDNNFNGVYEPLPNGPDHPDFIGDQVVWMVMNDGLEELHSLFRSTPMDIELQRTVFGFDRDDEFGDIMFIKDLIINKGENTINEMYIGLWSDPDLGDASDDFVGCDTTLGMGICYNDGDDVNFMDPWGDRIPVGLNPAVGYDYFQGPMVPAPGETAYMFDRDIPDMKNLKMTSFIKYIGGDPVYYDPNNANEAYNYLKGLRTDGSEFPLSGTGGSKFVHPGNPILDTGPNDTEFVDADLHASDDRRFLMSSGPFTMTRGDSQEVVYAIINAAGPEWDDAYLKVKQVDIMAQRAYDAHFIRGNPPPKPQVEVSTFEDQIILTWDSEAEKHISIDEIDPHPDNNGPTQYAFEGYNVYQLENIDGTGDIYKIATYDLINDVKIIMDDVFDDNYGVSVNVPVQSGKDSGIKRSINIDRDYLNDANFLTNREYYFVVTAYSYNEYGVPKTMESSKHNTIIVRPQKPNTWRETEETGIYGTTVWAVHTSGTSDGRAECVVIDPMALTGDDYEIFFTNEEYFRDIDGKWKNTNLLGKAGLQKILDCSGSTINVAAVASATVGTIDLIFDLNMFCGSNWVDGILLEFPDGVKINSWDAFGDCSYPDYGQNCVNMDGTYDGATNSLLWGDDSHSAFGAIEGSHSWVVNIDNTAFPLDVGYEVYDDSYDGTLVDGVGTAPATELGYEYLTVNGWYTRNLSTGEIVTPHSTIQGGNASDNIIDGELIPAHDAGEGASPIAEGLQFVVNGVVPGIRSVGVYANAAGPIDPPVEGLPYWRYPDWLVADGDYTDQQSNGSIWHFNTHPGYGPGGLDTFYNSVTIFAGGGVGIGALIPDDYEFRFTGNGRFFDNWGDGWFSQPAPFEVWNIGSGTFDDTADDYQLITWLLDDDASGDWGLVPDDHETSGGVNDPYTDRVYVHAPTDDTPGTVGHDNWWAAIEAGGAQAGWTAGPGDNDPGGPLDTWNVMSRTVFMNWNGGDAFDPTFPANINALEPEQGTVFRIVTTKPNSVDDKFQLSTSSLVGKTVEYDPDGINVWPNPYMVYNPEEPTMFNQEIHFTHLPEDGKCIIRIFDLAGTLIRKIDHNNGTQLEIWDVRNDYNWKIGSGMYIVHIETDKGEKILKLAIVQPQS